MLIQERESSSRQLRRIAFRFYNFCSCWITRQEARRFSPSTRDCEIIRRASRASVSDFRASQRERALSLFAHIARVCVCTLRCIAWVCTYATRALITSLPVAKESISKLRKAMSRVTMRKENVDVAAKNRITDGTALQPMAKLRILHSDEFLVPRPR